MAFTNDKKTFLAKQDKSKKGAVDEKVLPIISLINAHQDYYTTSSCSGRAYLWRGSGKKNETEWLKVSHELVDESFLQLTGFLQPGGKPTPAPEKKIRQGGQVPAGDPGKPEKDLVWLRVEPFILHVACKDLKAAILLLEPSRGIFKKSCILSASSKILVEIRGSEFLEMPLYAMGKLLWNGNRSLLVYLVNEKLKRTWGNMERYLVVLGLLGPIKKK